MSSDFIDVTEIAGDDVSPEQVDRLRHRYHWAGGYCKDKDVLEVACGTGQGVGYLEKVSRSMEAGDYSGDILSIARKHYGNRFHFQQFDALNMPFASESKDIVILFEALYYLPNAEQFVTECRRILRPGGRVLIATANKDLDDFNPSPYSHQYFGVVELGELFTNPGFTTELLGYLPIDQVSWRQRVLRPLKKMAVSLRLMPRTMAAKKILKRLVFGNLIRMPAELLEGMQDYQAPSPLPGTQPDRRHKVLYCVATLKNLK